jgi:C4-dicarboxylate transporter DctQ subunit
MDPRLRLLGGWLYRRGENIIAIMLGVMFLAFIAQIIFRYALNFPSGWAFELSLIMWLWLVPWGAAFVVTEREMIRFDLLYGALGTRLRAVTSAITGLFIIAVYLYSLPAVLDYVMFMRVETSSYLDIRFDLLYSIYPIFAVAVVCRYIWIVAKSLRGKPPAAFDPTKANSGV